MYINMAFTREQAIDAAKWWANYLPHGDNEELSVEKKGNFISFLADKIMATSNKKLYASEHEYKYLRSYYHTPREIIEIAVSAGIIHPNLLESFPRTASMVLLDDGQIHIYDIDKKEVLRESDNGAKHISSDNFDFATQPYLTVKMGKVLVKKIEQKQVGFVKDRYGINENKEEGWLYVQQKNQPDSIKVENLTLEQVYPPTMELAERSYISSYITDTNPDKLSIIFDGIPSKFSLREVNANGLYEYRGDSPIKLIKMEQPFTIGFGKEAQIGNKGDYLLYNTKDKTMSIASQLNLLNLGVEFYLSDKNGVILDNAPITINEKLPVLNISGWKLPPPHNGVLRQ